MTCRKKQNTDKDPGPPVCEPPFCNTGGDINSPTLPETEIYFFHPDHLGSTSYITNIAGETVQFNSYLPFGESFVSQKRISVVSNYLFNSKEVDTETGLYYYGARYYNPKISNWLSVDPIALYDPIQETEHYLDGQHNGGYFNPRNMSVYGYTYQNPVIYVDPNGKQSLSKAADWTAQKVEKTKQYASQRASQIRDYAQNKVLQSQNFVKENKQDILNFAEGMQGFGDAVEISGYAGAVIGTPIGGVGAAPGLAVAAGGNIISGTGSLLEIGTNLITGNLKSAGEEAAWTVGSQVIDLALDKAIPGPTPNMSDEIMKTVKTGKEILIKGAGVKAIIAERTTESIQSRKEKIENE